MFGHSITPDQAKHHSKSPEYSASLAHFVQGIFFDCRAYFSSIAFMRLLLGCPDFFLEGFVYEPLILGVIFGVDADVAVAEITCVDGGLIALA